MYKKVINRALNFLAVVIFIFTTGNNELSAASTGSPLILKYTGEHSALNAVTAYSSGISSILYNPASSAEEHYNRNFLTSVISMPLDVKGYLLTYSDTIESAFKGRYSFFIVGIDGGKVEQTMIDGREILKTSNSKSYSASQAGVSLSLKFNTLNYGMNLKKYDEEIAGYKGKSFLFDFGVLWKNALPELDFGVTALNIGHTVSFNKDQEKLSRVFAAGLKYELFRFDILCDIKKIGDYGFLPSYGLNFRFDDRFHIMTGYNGIKNINKNLSFGVAYDNDYFGLKYSFENYGDIGIIHNLSFAFSFRKIITRSNEKSADADAHIVVSGKIESPFLCYRCKNIFIKPFKFCPACGKENYNYESALLISKAQQNSEKTDIELRILEENKKKLEFSEMNISKLKLIASDAFSARQFEAAIEVLKKIIEFEPSNLEALKMLGDAYYELKDFDNALLYYSKCMPIKIK